MENQEKDYEVLIITRYKNFSFINTNKVIDTTTALGILAKATNIIASSGCTIIDPKHSTFPVFITVDEERAEKIISMTDEEWHEYTQSRNNEGEN